MSRTREERRRRRRIFQKLMTGILAAAVILLALWAIHYGSYLTDRALDSPNTMDTRSYLPEDFDRDAYQEALARYDYRQDPVLYVTLLRLP